MTKYIALLRGINVSGKNSIRMAALQNSFSALGFTEIQTYLQSGNVVFNSGKSDEPALAAAIQNKITQDFGLDVPVLVLTASKFMSIAKANPLLPQSGGDEKQFHCTFLFGPVSKEYFQSCKLPAAEGEQAVLLDNIVFLHCPHGYGKTKLNNKYFERLLDVPATTRNWRTVLALKGLFNEQ
jgi:uncharacterized protein (DUF1697 family)